MTENLGKLALQGRAFDGLRPWSNEELEALLALERGRGIARTIAADYIRNGILTVEDYDAAKEAAFVPLTVDDAIAKTEALLKENKFASKGKKQPPAETPKVAEPTVLTTEEDDTIL